MNSPLVHGVYDTRTLTILKEFGIKEFAFDLRGRSANLISFSELKKILEVLPTEKVYVSFENDRKETILSFLDLLRPHAVTLLFRDQRPSSFYAEVNRPFAWMLHPEGDWRGILQSPKLKTLFLPLRYQDFYQRTQEFWRVIEERNIETYLHASTFSEMNLLKTDPETRLSVDLTAEVEESYRKVSPQKLHSLPLWRRHP